MENMRNPGQRGEMGLEFGGDVCRASRVLEMDDMLIGTQALGHTRPSTWFLFRNLILTKMQGKIKCPR
jgi:hypothetical protein